MQEGELYYSGEHKMYVFKLQVHMRASCLSSAYSRAYAVLLSGNTVLNEHIEEHQFWIEKSKADKDIDDKDFMSGEYPDDWALLANEEYWGAQEITRYVFKFKKPALVF